MLDGLIGKISSEFDKVDPDALVEVVRTVVTSQDVVDEAVMACRGPIEARRHALLKSHGHDVPVSREA